MAPLCPNFEAHGKLSPAQGGRALTRAGQTRLVQGLCWRRNSSSGFGHQAADAEVSIHPLVHRPSPRAAQLSLTNYIQHKSQANAGRLGDHGAVQAEGE